MAHDDESVSRPAETHKFAFPELLDQLFGEARNTGSPPVDKAGESCPDTEQLTASAASGAPRAPAEPIAAIRQHFEAYVSENQPLPARMDRMAEELRHQLDSIEKLVSGHVAPPPPGLFDPRVRALLLLNYWHAVQTRGRTAAKSELVAIVKDMTRGAKGRPARMTLQQVQDAKRLREQDLSWGRIAKRLGLRDKSGRGIRVAVRYYFPDEKKSR